MSAQNDSIRLRIDPLKSGKLEDTTSKYKNYGMKDSNALSTGSAIDRSRLPGVDTGGINLKKITDYGDSNKLSTHRKILNDQKIKSLVPHGSISLGYDYGFLPYTVGVSSPFSVVKSEGRIETNILNIPIDVTYFYSTQKNLIGLTNYFRISYNADRYKESLNHKLNRDVDSYKQNLGALNIQKQQTLQKMALADYLSSINPDQWPHPEKPEKPGLEMDTSGINSGGSDMDTTGIKKIASDSLGDYKKYPKEDSLQRAVRYKNKKDSVARAYEDYKEKYLLLNDSIKRVENRIAELQTILNQRPSYDSNSPYLSKIQNFLSGVKKFDVGLCYPAYSTFLTNNIPVKGINFEYEKENTFVGFTYGTTVSTLLYNNRNIEGVLQNVRSSYNYFDANNLSNGRKILSLKFGLGQKNGDHFYAGFLIGKGASDYTKPESEIKNLSFVEGNVVLEADIRKSITKKTSLDVIIGKSSIQQNNLDVGTIQSAVKEVFSNFRSYAALVRLKTSIAPTKSNLTLSVRWVDPFFSSYGIGFMRSDNLRYEIKIDQPLTKTLKYTSTFRREEDNLLKLLNYKNTFLSFNNTISYKIKRNLVLRIGYTPLVRILKSESYKITTRNTIMTGIITFTPRSKNVHKQFSFLYNNYQVTTDTTPINFQNFVYYQQFIFKRGFKTGLNVSWFKNNLKDSTGDNTYLAVLNMGYQFKNSSEISVAGKFGYKLNGRLYPGFIVNSTTKLSKYLFWENQVEKFIVGDLFNGYDLENLKRFPYCITTKLILNF